jgi:hypothetical protein
MKTRAMEAVILENLKGGECTVDALENACCNGVAWFSSIFSIALSNLEDWEKVVVEQKPNKVFVARLVLTPEK